MMRGLIAFMIGILIGLPLSIYAVENQDGAEDGLLPHPELGVISSEIVEEEERQEEPAEKTEIHGSRHPDGYFHIYLTEEEKDLMMRLAQSEAGNQGVEGMALVMNVVNNRISSENFPGTVEEVIYQDGQFSPVGKLAYVEPGEEVWEALWMVQHGWDESDGALYFEAEWVEGSFQQRCCEFLFQKGGHKFYR